MRVHFATRIRFANPFPNPNASPFRYASPTTLLLLELPTFPGRISASVRRGSAKMAETARSTNPKRPVCPSCSKPARTCLCARIHSPGLDHPVRVTVLQHSLERKHPLNSTRILRLGLKNVAVAAVSDVNFGAEFSISPLEPHAEIGAHGLVGADLGVQNGEQSGVAVGNPSSAVESNGAHCPGDDRNCGSIASNGVEVSEDSQALQNSRACGVGSRGTSKPVISFRMGKKGTIESTDHVWMSRIGHQGADFDAILDCQSARDVLSNGFVVRKSQNLVSNLSLEPEEYEEFVLEVPRGSVLLFPTENALSIDELKAAEFEVRNLIVLDGTWMKAKRMYSEDPWLKLLPHLKLDLEVMSLYEEVRSQPKAGCLSTLESVIYTMKAIGGSPEGLDQLLDVFESMVDDQRRCKHERLGKSTSGIQALHGSQLPFPSHNPLGIDELEEAAEFEVMNLIVVGWKVDEKVAGRILVEAVASQQLLHLMSDLEPTSIYGNVRSLPEAGCTLCTSIKLDCIIRIRIVSMHWTLVNEISSHHGTGRCYV